MPVSHDASASAKSNSVSSLSVGLTIAGNSNRYLIVHVYAGHVGAPSAFSSVTWNTTENLALLWTATIGVQRLEAWGLKNPTATTANVTATYGATYNEVAVAGSAYWGVDQTTPTGTARTNTGTATTGWVATDYSGRPGGMVVGCGSWDLNVTGTPTVTDVNGIPEWIAAGALSAATAQTSRTPAAPAGALRGDLEIAHCSSENNATHSVSGSGWFKIGQNNSGASWTVSHYYRIRDGSNVDPVISWSGSADASARRYLFRDTRAKDTVAAPTVYHGTVGTGTASPHTSTGANTTENDVLAIYIDICNANTAMAAETSWTERVDSGSATGPVRSYLADREMATSGSATGNISEAGGAAAWVQQQFEVYNADNGDQTARTEQESIGTAGAIFGAVGVSDEVADTYNALGWTFGGGAGNFAGGAIPLNPSISLPVFNRAPHYLPRRAF